MLTGNDIFSILLGAAMLIFSICGGAAILINVYKDDPKKKGK